MLAAIQTGGVLVHLCLCGSILTARGPGPRTQETGVPLLATHNGPALLSSPPEAASALVSCGQREGMGDSEGRGGFEGALNACLPSLLVLEADMGALLGDRIFKAHFETDGLPEEVFPI